MKRLVVIPDPAVRRLVATVAPTVEERRTDAPAGATMFQGLWTGNILPYPSGGAVVARRPVAEGGQR